MRVFEQNEVVPACESLLEISKKRGIVGSVFRVLLRCVDREEDVNVDGGENQLWEDIDCQLWKRLPRDLASKIVFQHVPLEILLQQEGWPADHLIRFPPAQKHALFLGKAALHNFSGTAKRAEIPAEFTSAQPLALSDQGLLVVACFINESSSSKKPHCLACCYLPTGTRFEIISLPTIPRDRRAGFHRPKYDNYIYAHAFHPNKLASSYTLILAMGTDLFVFTFGTWRRLVSVPLSTMNYGGGICLVEKSTLPQLMLPKPFREKSGVTVSQGPEERFKLRYSVCGEYSLSGVQVEVKGMAVVCCMRLDTVSGEWEVMPGPAPSILQQLFLRRTVVLGGDIQQGVAVFEDTENRRLLLGFVEPWEWVLSTQIITLDCGSCKRGKLQLLLPTSKRA